MIIVAVSACNDPACSLTADHTLLPGRIEEIVDTIHLPEAGSKRTVCFADGSGFFGEVTAGLYSEPSRAERSTFIKMIPVSTDLPETDSLSSGGKNIRDGFPILRPARTVIPF